MADVKTILSLVATTSAKIKDLVIKNGQLIFLQDVGRIAFDFNGKRVFYNQIVEMMEADRLAMDAPISGYYFIIDTAILWLYRDGWIQMTETPQDIVFIGVDFPELGVRNTLYASTKDGNENISVWNEDRGIYTVVADKTQSITSEDVLVLFN